MGYDTHDQAKLLEADLAFIECLEKPGMNTKGDVHVAYLYKTMCIQDMTPIAFIRMDKQHAVELVAGTTKSEDFIAVHERNAATLRMVHIIYHHRPACLSS
ncbi:hypothetical protein AKJ16_DCAP01643 [Drosera capensis]